MNLSSLPSIFVNTLVPVVLLAGIGFVLARVLAVDARSLSRVSVNFFIPALLFGQMYRANIGSEFTTIAIYTLIVTALMLAVSLVVVRVMRYDRLTSSAFTLSVTFMNAGNYGLPLVYFAFGNEGLALAIIFFSVSAISLQTLAVFIAARGRASTRDALLNVFKTPLIYAVSLGLFFNVIHVGFPEPLIKSLDLAGTAAVPVMLTILGIELANASLLDNRFDIALATSIKLIVSPLVAFGLASVMGLQGLARAVCVIEASMPTAVIASILAVEFKTRPEFVSSVILVSTFGSIVSITILLGILS